MTEALADAGRDQAVLFLMETQAANTGLTKKRYQGFTDYFMNKGMDPAPWLARVGLSPASYYMSSSIYEYDGIVPIMSATEWNEIRDALKAAKRAGDDAERARLEAIIAESEEEHRLAWISTIESDREGLASSIADWWISKNDSATIPQGVRKYSEHREIAEANGSFLYGDYEGMDHESGSQIPKLFEKPILSFATF